MSDATRSENEPQDRLTRITDAMVTAMEAHPEYREGDKAIVLLDGDGHGGLVAHGYHEEGGGGDAELAHRLLEHARAVHEVNDIPFEVHQVRRGHG